MQLRLSLEIVFHSKRLSTYGPPHQSIVHWKIRNSCAHRKHEIHGVGSQVVRSGQRLGNERVEQPNRNAAGKTQANPCCAGLCTSRQPPICHCIEKDCDADQRDSAKKQDRIPFRRNDVVDDGSDHQRQTGSDRKRHSHARYGYRGHEKQVSKVEDDTTKESLQKTARTSGAEVAEKTIRGRWVVISERQTKQQRTRQKSPNVIPVVQFEPPPLIDLLCIRPTAPAEHAEQHKKECSQVTMRDQQLLPRLRTRQKGDVIVQERVTYRHSEP